MIEKLKGLLIEDWKRAWRLGSIWLAAALGLLDAASEYLPMVKTYLPEGWVKWIAIAIIVARLLKQRKWKGEA